MECKRPPQCRIPRFDPWVEKIPWRKKWQPTPVFFFLGNPMDRGDWGQAPVPEVMQVRHSSATKPPPQKYYKVIALFFTCLVRVDQVQAKWPIWIKLLKDIDLQIRMPILLIDNMSYNKVVQMVKNPPAMQETRVWSLGGEDPLEKEMATHSSILAWRIPGTEEPGGLQSTWSKSQTWLTDCAFNASYSWSISRAVNKNHVICKLIFRPRPLFYLVRLL